MSGQDSGTTSLVFGIAAIVLPFIGFFVGIAALGFAAASGFRAGRRDQPTPTLAAVGGALGAVGIILWGLMFVV